MPEPIVRAYGAMRSRIEARRWLDTYEAVAAGSGSMQKASRQRLVSTMIRRANGGQTPGARQPRTAKDWAAVPGMQVIYEKAPDREPPPEAQRRGVLLEGGEKP